MSASDSATSERSTISGRSDLWRTLTRSDATGDAANAWAALMLAELENISGVGPLAVLALWLDPATGRLAPLGTAPAARAPTPRLIAASESCLQEGRGVAQGDLPDDVPMAPGAASRSLVYAATPVTLGEAVVGAVAVEMRPTTRSTMQMALRRLQWGAAWVRDRLREDALQVETTRYDAAVQALNAVVAVAEQDSFDSAARAACTDLATRFQCDRVSLGLRRRRHAHVIAISHSAQFSRRMALTRALAATMDEAIDQRAPVLWPDTASDTIRATRSAAALAHDHGAGLVYTVPLYVSGLFIGAFVFERPASHPFDQREVEILEAITTVLAPVIEEKRRNDRWVLTKAVEAAGNQIGLLIGPAYVLRKLLAIGLIALTVFFWYARTDYTVTGNARVEGAMQRVIVPTFDGFIASAEVSAGDRVTEGQVLVKLDDRDLVLERLRLLTERQSQQLEYDRAVAARDRAEMRIRQNQIAQAEAQITLIDEQLSRTELVAPFDGLVIAGDLDQALGSAVSRGEALLTITPAGGYEVLLQIDERRIDDIAPGQSGVLRVAALPDRDFPMTVKRITPVATHAEGVTSFAVEAMLDGETPDLRPGMEGVGRIRIEERRLIDVWTAPLIDWARLAIWRWLPV